MIPDNLSTLPLFENLPEKQKQFIGMLAQKHPFTFQQLKMLTEYSIDLVCWKEEPLDRFYFPDKVEGLQGKKATAQLFRQFREGYEGVKDGQKSYAEHGRLVTAERKFPDEHMVEVELKGKIMGECPVASRKTRCCNLRTLDAVQQCGFDCSYCSIQSFYHGDRVRFIENLDEHLSALEFDENTLYHIGTGQSSDSLMWGNRFDVLQSLCDFARQHPNVLLEMKSKSGRVDYFIENRPPANMMFTWSLNTPVVIQHEEKGTANLDKRLESARKLADQGCPVGFHFHPMVWYEGWQEDYSDLVKKLTALFEPQEVVMVSLGTLTFIKSVLKRIRKRMFESSILQMPMEDCAGKLTYPFEIKEELFSTLYREFPVEWKENVFFYMCMEHIDLWEPVFGRSYESNEQFENDMLKTYHDKVQQIAKRFAARP